MTPPFFPFLCWITYLKSATHRAERKTQGKEREKAGNNYRCVSREGEGEGYGVLEQIICF
jgi:hypothetical protein